MREKRNVRDVRCINTTYLRAHCFPGGLFDLSESRQEVAFRYAVERVNANRKVLPNSLLSAQLEKIPPQDSFHASKRGEYSSKPIKYTYYYR